MAEPGLASESGTGRPSGADCLEAITASNTCAIPPDNICSWQLYRRSHKSSWVIFMRNCRVLPSSGCFKPICSPVAQPVVPSHHTRLPGALHKVALAGVGGGRVCVCGGRQAPHGSPLRAGRSRWRKQNFGETVVQEYASSGEPQPTVSHDRSLIIGCAWV